MINIAVAPPNAIDPELRKLAAAVMLLAVQDLKAPHGDESTRAADHASARMFFFDCLKDPPEPMNLNFCCEVLGLNPTVVVEAIRRQQIDVDLITRTQHRAAKGSA